MVSKKKLECKWFHGDERKTDFMSRNYFDVKDFSRDRNAMGPGIYFTVFKEQASGYAGKGGYVYTATVDLDPKRTLEDNTKPDADKLRKFIERCPDKDLLSNYSENPDAGVDVAVDMNMEYSDNMLDAIMGAYNDLYQRDAVLFAKVMVEIGYDAFYHKVNPLMPSAIHLIVYNPKIIKVLKEEKQDKIMVKNEECYTLRHLKLFEDYHLEAEATPAEYKEIEGMTFYHNTSTENKNDIISNGFDFTKSVRGKHYGNGIYFTTVKNGRYGNDCVQVKVKPKKMLYDAEGDIEYPETEIGKEIIKCMKDPTIDLEGHTTTSPLWQQALVKFLNDNGYDSIYTMESGEPIFVARVPSIILSES